MRISLITTPNHHLKETGFGSLSACNDFARSSLGSGMQVETKVCETRADLQAVVDTKPDLVVLAVKYLALKDAEELWLAKYFEEKRIQHTGSGSRALKLGSNKLLAKTIVAARDISTVSFFQASPGKYKSENDLPLPFPLFVKPMDAANGNGIDDNSLVRNFTEFEEKVAALSAIYSLPSLVERYLDGPEYTVSVLQTSVRTHLAPIEIIPPESGTGLRILGATVKRDNTESLRRIQEPGVHDQVSALALEAYSALGAEGFARIDIKSDSKGRLFFMEANLVPGMAKGTSYFPQALQMDTGLSHTEVVCAMLSFGLCPRFQLSGVAGELDESRAPLAASALNSALPL